MFSEHLMILCDSQHALTISALHLITSTHISTSILHLILEDSQK